MLIYISICLSIYPCICANDDSLAPDPEAVSLPLSPPSIKAENRGVVVTEAGSYLRLIYSQHKAQGPLRTCKESKEEEEQEVLFEKVSPKDDSPALDPEAVSLPPLSAAAGRGRGCVYMYREIDR